VVSLCFLPQLEQALVPSYIQCMASGLVSYDSFLPSIQVLDSVTFAKASSFIYGFVDFSLYYVGNQ
jgi:hypothetical protein